ncbi:hypothetical protein QQS21_007407 [Conoideocrella luteorostrata]|uniref:Uncharacterized protein n=1 Tax=Conoideocrella luteorostrata TaxID=1105319 RepID=A0AAJ0CLJ4_9HYPO|nr:hypothetical protein QQS21_007407 [Conoideocrella luteorostrata]
MANLPGPERATMTFGNTFNGHAYRMQPRINLRRDTVPTQTPVARAIWSILKRGDKDCHSGPDYDTCEKNINTNITNLAIILGVVIPVVVATIVLLFLHRRNVKKLRQEDAQDPHKGLDFGMGDAPSKGGKRKSLFGVGGEKVNHKGNQLSMDMNLSSPYLLPPNVHQSHDSVHSLARTFPTDQDPYRTVVQYTNSETGSVRSFKPARDTSLYNGSKRGSVISPAFGTSRLPPPPPSRSDSMPKAPPSPGAKSDPFTTPITPETAHQFPLSGDVKGPVRPIDPVIPEIGTVGYPDEKAGGLYMPDVQPPPRVLSQESHYELPSPPFEHDKPMLAELPAVSDSNHIGMAHSDADDFPPPPTQPSGMAMDLPKINSPEDHHTAGGVPGQALSHDDYGHLPIQASEYPEEQQSHEGLDVPKQQMKRLSIGVRPLPPDEVMESEDPEYRANRIRSFYKEYFDDKEAPPPMPGTDYYEDYDSGYLGDAAYYDAETNAFVMPYAQPVTRRAMTPPPAGRFRGGPGGPGPRSGSRGGPRGPGSVGGMSLPGGPRRPRAGSAYSPRPGSSASAGMRGRPKKNLPPPTALHTLPTPSKLRDDSFAIFNATDFAPPDSFREQASGRSQSPLGERRQYQPKLPVASPLVTAFDELSALPSPHLLRKSSTFTNLDFAPPKKFKDADTMSDAGSIKSNRSGISPGQLDAIRRGAGRVSRLPGDTVFTSAALGDTLKPQWGMRP